MRVPNKPPIPEHFFEEMEKEKLVKTMMRLGTPEVQEQIRDINNRYLHWDQIRFRTPPHGLKTTQLWHAVNWARRASRQAIPISFTTPDKKLHYGSPPKHLEWIHHIDKQGGGTVGVSAHSTLGDESDRYLFGSLMEEAIASSQLEGAVTTRKVAKKMLRENRKPRNDAEQMILNNYRAILDVRELRNEPLTPDLLCHLQGVLTEETLEGGDGVGRFRLPDEPVQVEDKLTKEVLHTPPAASELEWRIKEICDFANTESDPFIHPVVKGAILHFALGYVHPFVDGNGRTARAIFYWYMLKRDYWLFEYFPISKVLVRAPARYGRAYLYTETDEGDVTYFIRYNLQAVLTAMRSFHEYIAQEEREAREAARLLESYPGLNYRQRALIHAALKNSDHMCTVASHQGKYHVTNPTARTDLSGLVRLGLLQETKAGKAKVFMPSADLRSLLHLQPLAAKRVESDTPTGGAQTARRKVKKKAESAPRTAQPSPQVSLFD